MKRTASPARQPVSILARALLSLPLAAAALAADPTPAEPPAAAAEAPPAAPESTPAAEAAAEEEMPAEEGKAAGEEEASEESSESTPSDLKNWVELGVGGTFSDGRTAAFQERTGLPDGALGGLEGFHYERAVGESGLFKADGRAVFDNHDYAVKLDYNLPDKYFFRGGYREFRTWSDPSGGFFPATGAWPDLYDDALAYDTREFYAEAGLRMPKLPQLTIRYSHTERVGQKSSTVWGETADTGGRGPRSISPAVLDLERIRDLVMLDLAKTVKGTRLGLGLRYERQDNDDGRWLRRYPGESGGLDRRVTQHDRTEADLFNVHATSETPISSKVKLTAAYGFTDLGTDTSGYRVYGSTFDPDVAQRLPASGTFENLVGGSDMQQHVGNINLLAQLANKLVLVPSVRIESRGVDGSSLFSAPAAPFTGSSYLAENERNLLDVSEGLDLRYTGVTNWVFYARGAWLQGSGDLSETLSNASTATDVSWRETDDERTSQKYSAGANWYPWRRLSFGAEYYHKIRENEFDHPLDSTANLPGSFNRYSAFLRAQEFTTDDVNFRVTWRPRSNLSLIGRYDMQLSQIDSQADHLASVQAAELTSHIGSGSVSWVPLSRLYLQGSLSYVHDRTTSPVTDLTAAVQDAENDYWTANATVGFALDDQTDLEAQYLFYRADNFADNSDFGQPYGAGAEDHGVSAGILRRLSARVRLSLKYGFFTSHDQTSGGNRDYTSHLVYSTLQYRF